MDDYSSSEIEEALSDMGFAAEPAILESIRNQILSLDMPVDSDEYLFTGLDDLADLEESVAEHLPLCQGDLKSYSSLILEGYNAAQKMYSDIFNLEQEIMRETGGVLPPLYSGVGGADAALEWQQQGSPIELPVPSRPSPMTEKNAKSTDSGRPCSSRTATTFKPTGKLPMFQFDAENNPILLDREVEQELIKEVCEQKGIKRVDCPPPGKAPFRHDPVKRNAQYQECWKKFPPPGTKRRQALRWKIRELMIQRDIPELRLIANPGLKPRPVWIN